MRGLLQALRLEEYVGAFETAGYDDADFLRQLGPDQAARVARAVGMKPGHAHKFVKLAQNK